MGLDVLLVDDDRAFLDLCSRRLESVSDFNVFTALGCGEALDVLDSRNVDCVLSDYQMPCTDGLEFLEKVRSKYGEVPFVLLTSHEDSDLIREAFEKGADEYMSKELDRFQYEVLSNRITNLVENNVNRKSGEGSKDWYENNNLLKQVIGLAPVSIKIKDSDGKIVLANEAFADVMGTSVSDLIGKTFESSSLTDKQIEKIEETDSCVLENDEKVHIDEQHLTSVDGKEVILKTTKIPFSPRDSSEKYVLTVATDITDQKGREEALENILDASREMASAKTREGVANVAIDTMKSPDMDAWGIALYDEDEGVFDTVSMVQNVELFSELPSFDVEGSLAGEAFKNKEARFYEDLSSEKVVNPDTDVRSEIIMPLGQHGVFISGSSKKRDFDRTDINLMEIFGSRIKAAFDRAQREQDLRDRENRLEKQNQRLNKFASIISHDLRNPLNIAKGYLEMAFTKRDDEDLKEVEAALDRMGNIIESLLALAKYTEGYNEEEVDMKTVCRDAWSFSEVKDAKIQVKDDFSINADRDKLMHILENLFTNAASHGGKNVTVTVGKTENGFYVENDGNPIPKKARNKIFEFGYTESEQGTGLGLSIVKNIVEFHGWKIELKEGPKNGPRFEFTLT